MPTVTYAGSSFECEKAIKGSNYIELLDTDNCPICRFDGIVDFTGFTITDGSWSAPAGIEEVRAEATYTDKKLYLTTTEEIGDGTFIKFKAPCWSTSIGARIYVNGEEYYINSMSNSFATQDCYWAPGAFVSAIIDVTNKHVYVQQSGIRNTPLVVTVDVTNNTVTHGIIDICNKAGNGKPVIAHVIGLLNDRDLYMLMTEYNTTELFFSCTASNTLYDLRIDNSGLKAVYKYVLSVSSNGTLYNRT